MNWEELNELGSELLGDLESAFSELDFINIEREGITPDGSDAIYEVSVNWDYDDMDEFTDDDIQEALDSALSEWDDVTYDWNGSEILVALHVEDYNEDDEDDEDDEDSIDCPYCTGTAVWDGEFFRCDKCGFCGSETWRD